MAHVFISYDSEDREIAREIVTRLEAQGWSVWWDRRIPTGKTWRSVLDKALQEMDCMLVLWSSRSIESHWVIEEAEEGRDRGKLLPLLIEPVRPPRGFREIQALSFVDWDRSVGAPCFQTLLHDLAELTLEASSGDAAKAAAFKLHPPDPPPSAARAVPAAAEARRAAPDRAPREAGAPAAGRTSAAVAAANAPTHTRKWLLGGVVAAVCMAIAMALVERKPSAETAPHASTPQAAPAPEPQAGSGTRLVTPSTEPLVRSTGSLLAPLPARDPAERFDPLSALPRTPERDRLGRQLEERRKQREARSSASSRA
jgi:hypothetical protein